MTTWVTATVLQVLAERQLGRVGSTFLASELAGWVKGRLKQDQRTNATSWMIRIGFLTHEPLVLDDLRRQDRYTVTADGAVAIGEAARGQVRKSGPKGSRKPNPHKPDSLVMRLWALMRVRKILDSDGAAQTLCNAGDDDYARVRSSVVKYLRRWTDAGALEESARRVNATGCSNGFKRFVIKPEWLSHAEPPDWRQIKLQAARAREAQR